MKSNDGADHRRAVIEEDRLLKVQSAKCKVQSAKASAKGGAQCAQFS